MSEQDIGEMFAATDGDAGAMAEAIVMIATAQAEWVARLRPDLEDLDVRG